MQQYNHKYRVYERGVTKSANFNALLTNRTSVSIGTSDYSPHTGTKTPITGIRLKPYRNPPNISQFIRRMQPKYNSITHIWEEFKKAIFEAWKPDMTHLIGASSGYDSRLIAKAVQELRAQHGVEWMGETIFVELGGEPEGFTEIMKKLGLPYYVWTPKYDFEYFSNMHTKYNGLCAFPVNQWYDWYVKNFNQNEFQYFSGYGGNVTEAIRTDNNFPHLKHLKRNWSLSRRLTRFFMYQYHYQLSAFKEPIHSFHPFLSYRYIKACSGRISGIDGERMSRSLAREFVPECENISRMKLPDIARMGRRSVSEKTLRQLHDWYLTTRYGKVNPINPFDIMGLYTKKPGEIEYNKWWLKLCIANYFEARNNISLR